MRRSRIPKQRLFLICFVCISLNLFLCSVSASAELPACIVEHALPARAASIEAANRLIYPQTIDGLLREYFEKRPVVVRRRNAKFYSALMGLSDVLSVIEHGRSDSDPDEPIQYGSEWRLIRRVMREGKWWTGLLPGGKNVTAQIAQTAFYRHGFSLVINSIQNRLLSVYSAARSLEDALGWRINVNMYMSPTRSQGFEVHVDWMDGVVVQVLGNKQWAIYDPIAFPLPRADSVTPLPNTDLLKRGSEDRMRSNQSRTAMAFLPDMVHYSASSKEDFILAAGDAAYIPRGFAHEAVALPSDVVAPLSDLDLAAAQVASPSEPRGAMDLSLHLTFGIEIATHYSVEVLIQSFVNASRDDMVLGRFNDILHLNPDDDYMLDLAGDVQRIDSSGVTLRASREASVEQVLRAFITSTAGLHSKRTESYEFGNDIVENTHALRRAVGVTQHAIAFQSLNPSNLLHEGANELMGANFASVILYAVALDYIQVEYLLHGKSIRLRLRPIDRIRASFTHVQPEAIDPSWCLACLRNCSLCAVDAKRAAPLEHAHLTLEVKDINLVAMIAGVSISSLEEIMSSASEIVGYFDKQAVMELIQLFEWSIAGEVVREAYRGLFEGFDHPISSDASGSYDGDSKTLNVVEGRLCAAWKSFIEDIKKDRKDREVF